MKIKTQFTSQEILSELAKDDDFFLFDDAFSCCEKVEYKLTEAENGWLDFVRGRYSIHDYIVDNTDENGVTSFDPYEFSPILDDDGMAGKAVCLSDDTALQAIFFYGYREDLEA